MNAVQSLTRTDGAGTIATARQAQLVRITVADNGDGMTQDQLTRELAGFYTTKPHLY